MDNTRVLPVPGQDSAMPCGDDCSGLVLIEFNQAATGSASVIAAALLLVARLGLATATAPSLS